MPRDEIGRSISLKYPDYCEGRKANCAESSNLLSLFLYYITITQSTEVLKKTITKQTYGKTIRSWDFDDCCDGHSNHATRQRNDPSVSNARRDEHLSVYPQSASWLAMADRWLIRLWHLHQQAAWIGGSIPAFAFHRSSKNRAAFAVPHAHEAVSKRRLYEVS